MELKRAASIDVGSNTTLFLLADVDSAGKITIVDESSTVNGIGDDVFRIGKLSPDTVERNCQMVATLIESAHGMGASEIYIVGTAALRNAQNSGEFIESVERKTGIKIEIISGGEEALLTYRGFMTGKAATDKAVLLIDVGGGSTEFVYAKDGKVEKFFSLDIGAVKLLKKFPNLGDPADMDVFKSLRTFLIEFIADIGADDSFEYPNLILSGGTAAALAALQTVLVSYNGEAVEGVVLQKERISDLLEKFLTIDLSQRKKMLHFEPDRASVIIGGAVIILELMNLMGYGSGVVTHRGIRFGIVAERA